MSRRTIASALLILVGFLPATRLLALAPDEILLVVNGKVPESRKLAEFYAEQRHIPDGRIVAIDLDPGTAINPAEEMPFAQYEPKVAAPIRQFIAGHGLEGKIRCLVTFWGVPLRIGNHTLTADEQKSADKVKAELDQLRGGIGQQAAALEQSARELNPSFQPETGDELPQLNKRINSAMGAIVQALPGMNDAGARSARFLQLVSAAEHLIGTPRTRLLLTQPPLSNIAPRKPSEAEVKKAQEQLVETQRQLQSAAGANPDLADNPDVRKIIQKNLGLLGEAQFLNEQTQLFKPDETGSALDSELSLLWYTGYPKARWVDNPLAWRYQTAVRQQNARIPLTLMVMRLDGPSEQSVRNLITTSIKVEAEGLQGQVALDARGKPKGDAYGQYDETIRNLAAFLKAKTNLKVTLDNNDALIPENSLKDIALYCGWYSLRHYVRPGTFSPGAVGFHIASLELVSLRDPHEGGWVHGLMNDGVVGTLGPVAEPYLHSFPPADEFFILLLTGKLPLAEVYWRTCPLSSWMQSCIGDPLYTPYKTNPPVKMEDVPPPLRIAFEPPAMFPTTQPVEAHSTTQSSGK